MGTGKYEEIKYCIFDPTGNITALVETEVEAADRSAVAAGIMAAHPEVEQAGFVSFDAAPDAAVPVSLNMAGGEFCGNAAMCAAALYALRRGVPADGTVKVKVSGAEEPLTVKIEEAGGASEAAGMYAAAVTMPPAKGIGMLSLSAEGACGAIALPLVRLQGIDHMIIEPDSGFFGLKDDPAAAESLIRDCCAALGSDCLGMMFLGGTEGSGNAAPAEVRAAAQDGRPDAAISCRRRMTPLVYVPGADTMFWENSCASGSAAAGIWLARRSGSAVDVTLDEPAGSLRVESDPAGGLTVLHGTARMLTQETYKC